MDRLRLVELFDKKVALARDHVTAHPGARHLTDMLCDAGLAIHQHVQIVGIEYEKARSRYGGNSCGAARTMQRRPPAPEKPGAQPPAPLLELDLAFSP